MMNAAEIDVRNAAIIDESAHRFDVTRQQDAIPRVVTVAGQRGNRVTDVQEVHIHLRRNSHPIQLLLPLACRDSVIDENNELNVQRLSPADHDLAMNQPIIDPM